MTELEERIIAAVAEERGMEPQQILLSTGLADELGMDGFDAEDFFEAFGKTFNVDLEPLWPHWDQHFVGEGSPGCTVIIGSFLVIVIGELLHGVIQRVPDLVFMLVLALVFIWVYNRFIAKARVPVTVRDLVEAANAGKWVKQYGEDTATIGTPS